MKLTSSQIAVACVLAAAMTVASAQPKKASSGAAEQRPAAPQEPKRLSAQEIFSKGFEALQKNDAAGAVDLFRAGLESEPNDPNAWLYLSKAQALAGDSAGADQSKAKAIALGVPASSFETRKLSAIALPPFPAPTTLAAVSFSPELAKRLVEDPALRLPEPPGGADADAKPQFSYRATKDSENETHTIDAPFFQVINYGEGQSLGGFKRLDALKQIEIKGRLFGSTPGEKFAIKTVNESATFLAKQNTWAYSLREWFAECTALRSFSTVGGAKAVNAGGTLYECSENLYMVPAMASLQAARNAPKTISSPSIAYYAYIPSKRRVDSYYKEEAGKLNDYR